MKYQVKTTKQFDKEFKKLDRYTQRVIKSWITKNLVDCEDPRLYGRALIDNKRGMWRYRIGCYRIICKIEDSSFIILALNIGHRREIYD